MDLDPRFMCCKLAKLNFRSEAKWVRPDRLVSLQASLLRARRASFLFPGRTPAKTPQQLPFHPPLPNEFLLMRWLLGFCSLAPVLRTHVLSDLLQRDCPTLISQEQLYTLNSPLPSSRLGCKHPVKASLPSIPLALGILSKLPPSLPNPLLHPAGSPVRLDTPVAPHTHLGWYSWPSSRSPQLWQSPGPSWPRPEPHCQHCQDPSCLGGLPWWLPWFFFPHNFIYLLIHFWLCWVFCVGFSPAVKSGGYSLVAVLKMRWLLLLRSTGSRACRLQKVRPLGSSTQSQELWHMGIVALRYMGSSWMRDWTLVSCTGRRLL